MNIFATFSCPIKSARYLDDKRMIKMILESAQLLSNAIILNGGIAIYRLTHAKHPCTLWTKSNRSNYEWLVEHFIALAQEYRFRYNKKHKCLDYLDNFTKNKEILIKNPIEKFANCTKNKENNIDFTNINDVHLAYRLYLAERWRYDKRPAVCKIFL